MGYCDITTIEPDKRGGKQCIRRMRIAVYDVLSCLAVGMSTAEIIDDCPALTQADILQPSVFWALWSSNGHAI